MKKKGIIQYLAAGDRTTSLKQISHFFIIKHIAKVLDVHVSEFLGSVTHHVNAFTTRHETTNKPIVA